MQLHYLKERGALAKSMEPQMFSNHSEGFLAYRRDQVRDLRSGYRTALQLKEVDKSLAAPLQRFGSNPKERPVLPEDAQRLAQQFNPAPEDYYAQAVKATAEGQLKKARALFGKAEAQSLERAAQAEATKQGEEGKQGRIYVARARMESYAGKFTEAFSWYQRAAKLSPPTTPEYWAGFKLKIGCLATACSDRQQVLHVSSGQDLCRWYRYACTNGGDMSRTSRA